MVNYYRKNRLRRKRNKVVIKHKFNAEEYEQMRTELFNQLKEIKSTLNPFFRSILKKRMIKIHLENLLKAIKYYYKPQAQRISDNINTRFKKGARELFKLTRFLPNTEQAQIAKKNVNQRLQTITNRIHAQIGYIREIEEKRHVKRQKNINIQNIF